MDVRPFAPWSVEHLIVLAPTFAVPLARRDASGQRGRMTARVIALVLVAQMAGNLFLVGLDAETRKLATMSEVHSLSP